MIEGRADFAERRFNDLRRVADGSRASETMSRSAGWGAWLGWRLAILMTLLRADAAEAGANQWTTTGPADAGPVISLAVDPSAPETVYAGTGHTATLAGTVFKSTNGGTSWGPANSGLPDLFIRSLVIDPQTPSTIYAGTSGGVFKSVNGGESWGVVNNGLTVLSVVALAIDPQNPSVLYTGTTAGLGNGVFKTVNGGGSWTPVGTGLPNGIVGALAVDPQTPANVYAGTQFGLFKSTTGGTAGSWTSMNAGFTSPAPPGINALAIDPSTPATLYAGTGGVGVFKSTNGAATWTAATSGITSSLINGLALDSTRPNVLYAATSSARVFRTTNGGSSWTPLAIGLTLPTIESIAISATGTCLHAGSNSNGATGAVFDFAIVAGCGPLPPPIPPLVAAVLPSSRSVQVNTAATAFVTLINSGASPATAASIAPAAPLAATFSFQTTDPSTNQLIGTQNVPVDIPPGGVQTYLIALSPTSSIASTDVVFNFAAENTTGPTAALTGVNTLLLSSSFSAIPDIVALAATPTAGVVNIPGPSGTGVFVVATVNVGATGTITASADTGGSAIPVSTTLCETNPGTGSCISTIAPTVTTQITANETPTFAVFVAGAGTVPFDPATNRIFVRFKDAGGVTRGSTSVAVRTQ
jgi:photosystem II stability/assembly factor-like uncharacterized protein